MEDPKPPEFFARSNAATTSEHLCIELKEDPDSWWSCVPASTLAAFTKDFASVCALAIVSLRSYSTGQHHRAPAPKERIECPDDSSCLGKASSLFVEVDRRREGDLSSVVAIARHRVAA
mmetsp:Transcript_30248/g.58365  ORF Transcript_30248/g.58365 Transcript_30248/m.58365 type:complete len:119 (-) Transcript_30248:28-384(-)